jgi:hypothetical protein
MWLSVDPALEEYLPQTPNSDEAKEHNKKLPGMGGAFNTVNLNLYHYAGNNPVKLVDPDGREDIIYVKTEKKLDRFESEGYAYKNGTFTGKKFQLFQAWAKIKEFFGMSVGKADITFFFGKPIKTFENFSTLPDSTTEYGTVQAGILYDYTRHDFGGMEAYLLTDPNLGDGKVPQDAKYGNPEKGLGKNPAFLKRDPPYVSGSHLHKAFLSKEKWSGSRGCIIQKDFQGANGMGAYLKKSPTGQSGRAIIFR